jgi:SAM-dependent methyltransferase
MTNSFDEIKEAYASNFKTHGVSSAAMLMPKGRHEARYAVVAEYLNQLSFPSLLDYGCGLGFLYEFLTHKKSKINYFGVDMTAEFIESCRERFPAPARFEVIDPTGKITEHFDVVYASGVFNLKTAGSSSESLNYVRERLQNLYSISKKVLIVDFLSPDVDFKQEKSQHIDYRLVLDWLVPGNTRRWVLRHDYLPYEYAIVLFKDDEVKRPENVFLLSSEQ